MNGLNWWVVCSWGLKSRLSNVKPIEYQYQFVRLQMCEYKWFLSFMIMIRITMIIIKIYLKEKKYRWMDAYWTDHRNFIFLQDYRRGVWSFYMDLTDILYRWKCVAVKWYSSIIFFIMVDGGTGREIIKKYISIQIENLCINWNWEDQRIFYETIVKFMYEILFSKKKILFSRILSIYLIERLLKLCIDLRIIEIM